MPAITKNLQPYPPLDTLSRCVQKLRVIQTRREEMLASCSFADEKLGSASYGPKAKKRRVSPEASNSNSKLSNTIDFDYIAGPNQEKSIVVLDSEIQASQEDDWSQTKISTANTSSRKRPIHESKKSLERIIKILYTGLTSASEVTWSH
jgi:hypothetical protein